MSVEDRLNALGLTLPVPAAPVATYRPYVIACGLMFVSGQVPIESDGAVVRGRLGNTMGVEAGAAAARSCALMLLAQVREGLNGDLNRVTQVVRLGVFVSSADNFTDQPIVANGASDLMVALFGDSGRHVRTAVGVPVLPLGAAVEVDGIFAFR